MTDEEGEDMQSTVRQSPANGRGPLAQPAWPGAEYVTPPTGRSAMAQISATLGLLAGLWVAISPWFVTLEHGGGNATVSNLITGLAIAAIALFAIAGPRGFMGLQAGTVLLGLWVIISPFILTASHNIVGAMYWTNTWTGAVIMLLGLAALGSLRPARAAERG